ncbi:MAG: CoA-binding protein [Nanoarchaeota archaeon]
MNKFFNPAVIAIIGASEDENKVGGILVKKLIKYAGKIVLVNPNHDFIQEFKVYKKITDFPGNIDLAIIAVPSEHVYLVLEECAKKKIKNIIIISSGFSEIGKIDEEKKLIALCKKNEMRILGPNCFGICNPCINLDMTFSASMPEKGDIAFVSQSGALWSFISDFSIGKFGFSGFVSLGNMADLEFPDFIEYFSKDEKTKSIVLYIEKLKDGRRFIEACRKCKKKIFAVKAGSSEEGSKAAVSHTGSLATDFAVYAGAFKQAGVELCSSLEEAFSKAAEKELLDKKELQKLKEYGKRAFIITNAGGAGVLASDYLSNAGFEISNSNDLKNPWDILGTADSSDYAAAFEKIAKRDFFDFIIVIATPQSMTDFDEIADKIIKFNRASGKKVIGLFLGGQVVESATEMLQKNEILCFNTLEEFRRSLG